MRGKRKNDILPTTGKTFINAFGAGVILAFVAAASCLGAHGANIMENIHILQALIFPMGLILIVFARLSLFTGCIYTFSADIRRGASPIKAIWLLAVTWVGNLIGSIWIAFGIRTATTTWYNVGALVIAADTKMAIQFPNLLVLGLFCNVLVCAAIAISRKTTGIAQVLGIGFPVFLFIFFGFEHSVADMFYLLFASNLTVVDYFATLGIISLGNIIGGLFVVAFDAARGELV